MQKNVDTSEVLDLVQSILDLPTRSAKASMEVTPEWDSFAHVSLMLGLETLTGCNIEPAKFPELVSVERILRFLNLPPVDPSDCGGD
jgi:acyl carrier protein